MTERAPEVRSRHRLPLKRCALKEAIAGKRASRCLFRSPLHTQKVHRCRGKTLSSLKALSVQRCLSLAAPFQCSIPALQDSPAFINHQEEFQGEMGFAVRIAVKKLSKSQSQY